MNTTDQKIQEYLVRAGRIVKESMPQELSAEIKSQMWMEIAKMIQTQEHFTKKED
jgi:hypothetical protein